MNAVPRRTRLAFLAFSLSLVAGSPLGAQTTTAIRGAVTDPSGAAVPNAHVVATETSTNQTREANTSTAGEYTLEFVPIGTYQVEVTASGFRKFVRQGIELEINQVTRVDAALSVGPASDAVTVTAEVPQINTDNASIGRTVENAEIVNLPIVNRNVYTLLTLTPGVESSQNSIVLGYPEQRTMIHGGVDGGAGGVSYYLDGGNNMTGLRNTGNGTPNPDAVQEFRIITNSYSAEFGRFAGGVVNVITRSGNNQFHGSVFEFLRNDLLNANVWAPGGAPPKAPLRRNQFGASAGGPIKRDKTFFFATYSGLRQITSTLENNAVVPTSKERAGNFSQSKVQPIDPLTKQPFPDNTIPSSRFDPTALNILNQYIPLANQPQSVYTTQLPNTLNTDEAMVKIDHTLTDHHRLSASYFETTGHSVVVPLNSSGVPVGNLPWSNQQFDWHQQNLNASDTWLISPTAVDQVWATYTRNFGGRLNVPGKSLGDFGSRFVPQGTPSLPQITVSGYFTLGQSIAGPTAGTNNYSVRNTLSLNRGRHLLKLGGEASLNKDVQQTLLNNYGVFSFSGAKTNNGLADFLLGLPVTMNQDAPVTALDNSWSYGFFVQDDFRVLRNLVLNLGLRWDLQTPPTDPFNREATFEPGVRSTILPSTAPVGLLVPGDPGVERGIVPMQKRNLSPRLGFAWDPGGKGRTSIRAAAGIFYGSVSGNEWNTPSNFQPFAVRQQFNNILSLTNPYGLFPGGVSPFPYSYNPKNPQFILPANLFAIDSRFVWPYTYQFNFSAQQEFLRGWTATASYVGTEARRLPFAVDINYPVYNSTATTGNVNNRRPIDTGTAGSILLMKSIMNASYNGLQLTVEKRMGRYLGLKSFYTFSKSLDGAQLQNNTTQGLAQDFNNLSLEKGRGDFDRRHNFVTSFIWQLDYFNKMGSVPRAVLGGWSLSAIASFRSGIPLTVTSGKDNNLDGNNNDRANLIGNPYLDPHRSRSEVVAEWFNTAAFAPNPAGTDGNAGRNIIDGPGLRNVDLALFRVFRIRERLHLQARAEMTNAFNLVSLSIPSAALATTANPNQGVLTSGLFGQIRNASDMRQTQVGLRLTF
jgi:hypothetical protein